MVYRDKGKLNLIYVKNMLVFGYFNSFKCVFFN